MSKSTEELKNEHGTIVRMLRVMSKASDNLMNDKEVDPKLWRDVSEFLRDFVDRCHHGKEENYLFPTMMERGVSGEVGLIEVLLREHDDGRAHAKRLRALVARKQDSSIRNGISKTVRAYVDLLTMHIKKENGVLFPLADELLTPEDQRELEAGFEKIETEVIGPGVHARYERMIEDWTARYG